jgi:hypothetical protein
VPYLHRITSIGYNEDTEFNIRDI